MRESVGTSVNSSHLEWREYPGAIDRITALGASGVLSPLGASFYRSFVGGDRAEMWNTMRLLADSVRVKLPRFWREAVAQQVLIEKVNHTCTTCAGRGGVRVGDSVFNCAVCEGVGLRHYSDRTRARRIGVDLEVYRRKFAHILHGAHETMDKEIVRVNAVLREKLR